MICKHKWQLGKIQRHTNRTDMGWTEWACEKCGAVKQLNFKKVDVQDVPKQESEVEG